MSLSLRAVAASSYSGSRALQWPHHGAKTADRIRRRNREGEVTGRLTFGENKIVLLDERLKGVLLELSDIAGEGE